MAEGRRLKGRDPLGLRRALADRLLPALVAAMALLAALAIAGADGAGRLAERWQQGEAGNWLRFHCGAPAADAGDAAFAILPVADLTALPGPFRAGNEMFPDQATTLILQLPALTGGASLEMSGPGIPVTRQIAPLGLPDDFPAIWAANHRLYPLGVDLILVSGHQIMGLPRSARLVRPDHHHSGREG